MMIHVTHVTTAVYDELDSRFVVTGLPAKCHSIFWQKVVKISGCSCRAKVCDDDGRLRVGWNHYFDHVDFLRAKRKIVGVIKELVPDAMVRFRRLSPGLTSELEYSPDDEMAIEGGFTDEEKGVFSKDERAAMLGIKRQ